MNKTKIEWCDSTWNPVTGCYHDCPYCYARTLTHRFGKPDVEQAETVELNTPRIGPDGKREAYPTGFTPTLHRYRLADYEKKPGRTIFVCSMADLFGKWVPDEWIEEVFAACERAPQHRYLFLTKNPARYIELARAGKLPARDNMWYGTTAATPSAPAFFSEAHNTFVSIEPILEPFDVEHTASTMSGVDWFIVGAETGNRADKVTPEKSWIDPIVEVCEQSGRAVFMKDSLVPVMGEENMKREFPWREEADG